MEELELVAGGTDTIVVVAPDGDGGGDWGGGDWGGDYGDFGDYGGGDGGGGDSGGGGDPPPSSGEQQINNEFSAKLQQDPNAQNVTVVIGHKDGTSTQFNATEFSDGTFFTDMDKDGYMDAKLIQRDGQWYEDSGDGNGYQAAP